MQFENLEGRILGQYELRSIVGAGNMGAVYSAYQKSLDREVAVKVLPPALATQSGYLERFRREAATAAALEHPHIVPVYDFGNQGSITYVVMRLLRGGSLKDRLQAHREGKGPLPSLENIGLMLSQLAGALDYAHSKGVIHRDIKPGNVMFDDQGSAILVDFGIAKLTHTSQVITQIGQTPGTPMFMAPEMWREERVLPQTDQYALAVMLYYALIGKPPYEAETMFNVMHMHMNAEPPPIHEQRPDIPQSLTPILMRALAKEPGERFSNLQAFATAFNQAVNYSPDTSSQPPSTMQPMVMTGGPVTTPPPLTSTPITSSSPTGTGVVKPWYAQPVTWLMLLVLVVLVGGLSYVVLSSGTDDDELSAAESTQTAEALGIAAATVTHTPTAQPTVDQTATAQHIADAQATTDAETATAASPTPSDTPTAQPTVDETATAQGTANAQATIDAAQIETIEAASSTPSDTPTAQPTVNETATAQGTADARATADAARAETVEAASSTPSDTPTAQPTVNETATAQGTADARATADAARAETVEAASSTPSDTPTAQPTVNETATAQGTADARATADAARAETVEAASSTPSDTLTAQPTVDDTASPTPSNTPTARPSSTLTATTSPSPTTDLTATFNVTQTAEAAITQTAEAFSPTPTVTPSPTIDLTATFSVTQTAEAAITQTAESFSPTPSNTPTPSLTSTPSPTSTPTLTLTPSNTPDTASNIQATFNAVRTEQASQLQTQQAIPDTVEASPTVALPTPTPTLIPGVPATIASASVNLRAGPSTDYPVVEVAPSGLPVEILALTDDREWGYLRFDDEQYAWIAMFLLTVNESLAEVPNVENSGAVLCPVPDTDFAQAWANDFWHLGCASDDIQILRAPIQRFENGFMFYRRDQQVVVVVSFNGYWDAYQNTYDATVGLPCWVPNIQEGPFGQVFCENPSLGEEHIGSPTEASQPNGALRAQQYEEGLIVQILNVDPQPLYEENRVEMR